MMGSTINKGKFGDRLKQCRQNMGITVSEMSVKTGIPVSTIETHLAGKSIPRGDALLAYSELFGASANWLLRGEVFSHVPLSRTLN